MASAGLGRPVVNAIAKKMNAREQEVHRRAGDQHDGALPDRRPPERPVLVRGRELVLERGHPDDLHEAAGRDRLHAVLGLAAPERPQRRAEAGEVLRHLHAEALGGEHVTGLVQADRHQDAEGEDEHAEPERHAVELPEVRSRARSRAQVSAAENIGQRQVVPKPRVLPASCSSRTAATVSTMPGTASRPARKASTHTSLAALSTAGAVPPAQPGPTSQPYGGERLVVERQELPGGRRRPVAAGRRVRDPVRPAEGERDRQPHVGRAGLGDGRAVGELDHRVHDRLRVHDDVDAVEGDVEEQVRLDHLEALVDQGRRVDRDDRAHVPGRVRERLLAVSRRRARRGCGHGTARRSRSAPGGGPRRPTPLAGTAPAPSAPSRPARAAPGAARPP